MPGAVYLDSSALAKLVIEERETVSLRGHLAGRLQQVTSCLAEVEVLRGVQRSARGADLMPWAREVLGNVILLELNSTIRAAAAALAPLTLRSLDAIHLASALAIERDLEAFVAYDRRLFAAALAAGLPAIAPGQA